MAEIQITTTQNVTIDFKAADAGERISAYLLDGLIKCSYIGTVAYFIGTYSKNNWHHLFDGFKEDYWSFMAIIILLGIPVIFYTIIQESLLNGQTLGKKVLKIKVVKIDGFSAGALDYFIRWVMRIVDINMCYGIVALVTIGSSKKQQRLGGIASGTAVITLKNKATIDQTILQEVETNYQPFYTSVLKLSDNDVRIVKENYLRALKKNDIETLGLIKDKIINVIGQEPSKEVSAETFIKRVIKDYNHYTGVI